MKVTYAERIFTADEIQVCRKYYSEIVEQHELCQGSTIIRDGNSVRYCDCLYVFDYVKELVYSGIPRRHWNVRESEDMKLSGNCQENLDRFFADPGMILVELENPGAGKTRTLSYMGKRGIYFDQSVYYVKSKELVLSSKLETEDHKIIFERVMNSDIVLLDDLELLTEYQIQTFNSILSSLYDKGVSICAASSKGFSDFSILNRSDQVMVRFEDRADIIHNFFENRDFLLEAILFGKKKREVIDGRTVGV